LNFAPPPEQWKGSRIGIKTFLISYCERLLKDPPSYECTLNFSLRRTGRSGMEDDGSSGPEGDGAIVTLCYDFLKMLP
jgi:hypothetical protein